MVKPTDWRKTLRLPAELHTRLVKEAGERAARTGQPVSINALIVDILEAHFRARGRRAANK